jgi:hypothetical protein
LVYLTAYEERVWFGRDREKMEEQEKYLGEVRGSPLKKGLLEGYALYATTHRIIGVKERRDILLEEGKASLTSIIYEHEMKKRDQQLESEMETGLGNEQMKKILEKKDLEIRKDEIKAIQLRKNGSVMPGHVKFLLKSGNEIEIKILSEANRHPGFFQRLGALLQVFFPEGLEIQE